MEMSGVMGELPVVSYQFSVEEKRVESSKLRVEEKEKQIPRFARGDTEGKANPRTDLKVGHYKSKDRPKNKPKIRETAAFDRKSPRAKGAKDGAPSSSYLRWRSTEEAR
jgi:hypothetical protein